MNKPAGLTERILIEDALKHIYMCQQDQHCPTLQSLAGSLQITLDEASTLIANMVSHHLIQMGGDTFQLTPEGQEYALQVIRAHRLWEHYLAEETGFPEAEWHDRAHYQEHLLSPAETEALSAKLGHPTHDPHGDPIPTAHGELPRDGGQPLTALTAGEAARIVHLEDEPEIVYAQLVAEGLAPGMEVRLTEVSGQRICFRTARAEHILAPVVAANISVALLPKEIAVDISPGERLVNLEIGERGKVLTISPTCRGPERRRLMDLGILPGTVISAEMKSPSGDPTAYSIRGALIALRREQANLINITRLEEVTQS
jgi:DtxR family Mn-dependent transcriptional regulator